MKAAWFAAELDPAVGKIVLYLLRHFPLGFLLIPHFERKNSGIFAQNNFFPISNPAIFEGGCLNNDHVIKHSFFLSTQCL